MKRILSLTLSLALLTLVFSSVMARPSNDGQRLYPMQVDLQPITGVQSMDARADTLFLFEASGGPSAFGAPGTDGRGFTFDTVGGSADCGWVGVDKTEQPDTYWHLEDALGLGSGTDMSGALPFDTGDTVNDYAMHCGRWGVCGWASEDGYGNNWDQHLRLTCGDFTTSALLELVWMTDYEGDVWDNGEIFIETFTGGVLGLEQIYASDVVHETTLRDTSFVVLESDYPVDTYGDFIVRFHSDGAWSDEDGLLITDVGAMWLDNIRITRDGSMDWENDFETGVMPATVIPEFPTGAGEKSELYNNLYTEDVCSLNMSFAWAFFDLNTINPNYPIPVIQYGPPYLDNDVQSPLLTMAHEVDNPAGTPMVLGIDTQVNLDFWVYADIPSDALIYYSWSLASFTEETGCVGTWKNDNFVYFGDDLQWGIHHEDQAATLAVQESAQNGTVTGIKMALNCVDMCPFWCDSNGSGENHTPGPFLDVARLTLVEASSVAWDMGPWHVLQDNFPLLADDGHGGAAGKVRIDPASNVEQIASPIVVHGDSALVSLNMDGHGGIRESMSTPAGENRPELWMYFQVVSGPHAGMLNASMGDPDGTDGIFSPYEGTVADPEGGALPDWGIVRCDLGYYQGTPQPAKYAMDLADNYFEAGDVIHYFFHAVADDGYTENFPAWALSSTLDLRNPWTLRLLPSDGTTILLADDANGTFSWWEEGFQYNGYSNYDIYRTRAPSSGQENGLAGHAVADQLAQYHCIIWDSGNLQDYAVCSIGSDDKTEDDVLLTNWLTNANSGNVGLWMFGDLIAEDLGEGSGFLANVLGAGLMTPGSYYGTANDIVVPKVFATDPALAYLGGEPSFWVDGGCPSIENFDLVEVVGAMASVSHEWQVQSATEVAGIKNLDPDGNSSITNEQGYKNPVVFHPYSYYQVWDAGYAASADQDYARLQVGHVLANIFECGANTAPDGVPETPAYTRLDGNFPNPFNPNTKISMSLASKEHVSLAVYDISGRLVTQLVNEVMDAGDHQITWNGKDDSGNQAASGVYFYKMNAGNYSATDKMVMLK